MTRVVPCHASRDDGRVMLLVVGIVVVLAMLVAVVVDVAHLYLARRSLDAATDAAALAGVQAADLGALYAGQDGRDVPLDERAVRRAVNRYIDNARVDDDIERFELEAVVVTDTQVSVSTRSSVRLPFVGPVTNGRSDVVVRSTSTARNRFSAP